CGAVADRGDLGPSRYLRHEQLRLLPPRPRGAPPPRPRVRRTTMNAAPVPDAQADTGSAARGASVVSNVLQVIRCFTVEEPQQGVTEIAEKVGLHKSSVSRILATLEQERVVERDEASRRYRLGLGLIAVAGPLLAELDVRRVALEDLQELAERTGETSALAVWNGAASVTVEQVPSRHQIKHTSVLGSHYRTALSSTVQVLL